MTPVLHHRGPAGQQWLENEKAPSVTGGAKKSLCAAISAHENSLIHPLKVDPMDTAHIQAV